MRYIDEEQRPKVLGKGSLVAALVLHAMFFGCCWLLSMPFREKEIVIPIELTFEAPPTEQEPPPQPKPVVKQKEPEPEPPKIEDKKLDAVIKDPPKKKPPKKPEVKKPPEKPKEVEKPKEPEKPKKTAAQLRKERLEAMRKRAKPDNTPRVVSPAPSGTGKTLAKDLDNLIAQGYKPGAKTQLAESETQRCISLIRDAFHRRWEPPAWNSSLKEMVLEVTFDKGGRVVGYKLVKGSGDGRADKSVLFAASRVGSVAGLSIDFLERYNPVEVNFTVEEMKSGR